VNRGVLEKRTSFVQVLQHFWPLLLEAERGTARIVNMTSIAGEDLNTFSVHFYQTTCLVFFSLIS
jgi:hypothetical protein